MPLVFCTSSWYTPGLIQLTIATASPAPRPSVFGSTVAAAGAAAARVEAAAAGMPSRSNAADATSNRQGRPNRTGYRSASITGLKLYDARPGDKPWLGVSSRIG